MYDIQHLDRLRQDCEFHQVDYSRAKLIADPEGGGYLVTHGQPIVPLGQLGENVPSGTVGYRSAESAEAALLDGLLKLIVAERRRVRYGAVCGMGGDQIARTPLTEQEIAAFKARTNPSTKIAALQRELAEALAEQAARERSANAAEQLAAKYGPAAAVVQTVETPSAAISGRPSKAKRASRNPEVNSHE